MRRNRRFAAAAFATAMAAGSLVVGISPASAGGNWFIRLCDNTVAMECSDGQLDPVTGQLLTEPTPTTMRWEACESPKYKASSFDGLLWQNGPGGRTSCVAVRGSAG